MIRLELRFPAGRYHATPWGNHVNEGVPEWPPSPWRLLRAVLASWFHEGQDVPEPIVRGILQGLAAPPRFHLPEITAAHTRQYQPLYGVASGDSEAGKTSLVFDTFAALDREASVLIEWQDAVLTTEERSGLTVLLARMTYLGRAESWCDARLLEEIEVDPALHQRVARPLAETETASPGEETRRVLCWEAGDGEHTIIEVGHPLLAATDALRKQRLDPRCPPGGRWVRYGLANSSARRSARAAVRARAGAPVMARLGFHSAVLPRITETVPIAELLRDGLQAQFGRLREGASSPTFSGKSADGVPLEGHRHAHYLPMDEDRDGHLDGAMVYAPMGFEDGELAALRRLTTLRRRDDPRDLDVILLGVGGEDVGRGIVGPARVWTSVSPFLLPRHPKKNGRDGPNDQLFTELQRRGLPAPAAVERLEFHQRGGHHTRWLEFRRWRCRGSGPALMQGFGFRLEFAEPVSGPIALGYGSHYGLGLFLPAD